MSVLTLILAGGQSSRLSVLGEKRAKPAVAFAGKYRITHSVLSPGVRVEAGAIVRDAVFMNDTIVGPGADLRAGADDTPNQLEPAYLNTGITIAGKRARIPAGAVIGRNCRIDSDTTENDYDQLEFPSGDTVSKRLTVIDE